MPAAPSVKLRTAASLAGEFKVAFVALDEAFRDADVPVSLEVNGVAYYPATVAEPFAPRDCRADRPQRPADHHRPFARQARGGDAEGGTMKLKSYTGRARDILAIADAILAKDDAPAERKTAARDVVRLLKPRVAAIETALPAMTRPPASERERVRQLKTKLRDGLQAAIERADDLLELPPYLVKSPLAWGRWSATKPLTEGTAA